MTHGAVERAPVVQMGRAARHGKPFPARSPLRATTGEIGAAWSPPLTILRAMDWKLFASTFVAIFLAEIGDKTQLATLSLAAGGSSRWVVFAASAGALVVTSAIAVLAGEALSRAIPPIWLKRAAGALFLVLGVVFLMSRGEEAEAAPAPAPVDQSGKQY